MKCNTCVQCAFARISVKTISFGCKNKIVAAQHVSRELYLYYTPNIRHNIRIRTVSDCIECLMSLGRVCTSVVFLFRGNPLPQNLSRYITTIFRVFTWLWIYRFDFVWVENQIQSIISAECTSKCGLQTNMFEKCLEMMKNFLMCQQWWMPKFQK